MSKTQRADVAKKQFIVRQVLIFGGLSSLLGISGLYYRHFGWHFGFDFHFVVRGLGVLVFWIAWWYLLSLWIWSRTSQVLKRIRERKRQSRT